MLKSIHNKLHIGQVPLPSGPGGRYTSLYGTNLALFSNSDNAAWDFMKFLVSPEANATFVQATGYIPVRSPPMRVHPSRPSTHVIPSAKLDPNPSSTALSPASSPPGTNAAQPSPPAIPARSLASSPQTPPSKKWPTPATTLSPSIIKRKKLING
ncbi:extracellular solute-binding protein [Ktedonobacter sp. SOSP1-52]|uniref:extracellular solute-binding protein n=1 Tax=Ktedonobacter sp. SOSP1-52 TaxID=2778366 RepID=UPI0027DAEF9E|nr:extracellular solute-binding protein [Ktedonobacter sp. SOSP1-52]